MADSDTRTATVDTSVLHQDVISSGADVRCEQTELVYIQAPVALLAALAVSFLITVGLWGVAEHYLLFAWIGAQLIQTLLRFVLVVSYRRSPVEIRRNPVWANLYLAGTLVSGIIWGCIGLFIEFSWPVEYQTLIVMGLAGVLAGAISSYAILMPVYISFMAPAILIPAQSIFMQADQSQSVMGLLFVVFAAALIVIARNYNSSVIKSLSLRNDNKELLRQMTRANEFLESEIQERKQAEKEIRSDRRLFTKGPVTVFRWRAEDGWPIEYVSRTVSQYGYDPEELMEQRTSYASLIYPNDLQRVGESEFNASEGDFTFLGIDYRIVRSDGQIRWVYDYTIPIRDDNGNITHYAGYLLDITDRKQGEFDLQQEKERAQITLHSICDAVITTDVNGQIEYLNPTAEQLTGWEGDIARGVSLSRVFSLFDAPSRESIENPVSRSLQAGSVVKSSQDCILQRHDGRKFSIQYSASPILGRKDNPLGVVLVFHDVTEIRSMAQQLSYQSSHDPLTGLLNRQEFEARLECALESTRNQQESHILCYIDLDQFKIVNDTCGHSEGDNLLRDLARLLPGSMRESDVLARLGGDEFGILLKNCSTDGARELAQHILSRIHDFRYVSNGNSFEVSASIGMVPLAADSAGVVEVMSAADLACYAAKDLGGNRIHFYEASDDALAQRHSEMQWVTRLRNAINTDRLVLYCQDIVPVTGANDEGRHFEILVRMLDDDGALVPPDRFLPAAERYNLIATLDRWVIANSFAWYHRCAADNDIARQLTMGINLSGASIADVSLLQFIKDALDKNRVPPEAVCFEITETAAISCLDTANGFIRELRQLGCCFALDDFGSGLSSFGYLKNLPVDYLKIDGSFVRGIETDPVDYAMVNAIYQLGKMMGIKTVAEFVENSRILEKLAEIGVDYAQGYGISKPGELQDVKFDEQQTA